MPARRPGTRVQRDDCAGVMVIAHPSDGAPAHYAAARGMATVFLKGGAGARGRGPPSSKRLPAPDLGCAPVPPPPLPPQSRAGAVTGRLLIDRRGGIDRRETPRRSALTRAPQERRRVVDRRRGPERRSTLDRRGRPSRRGVELTVEAPGEHLRNALQLLSEASESGESGVDWRGAFDAALERIQRALRLLEHR